MLKEIYIKNFALIDEINIQLNDGLNVFTGETGSGKSIIIDAIFFILGKRADKSFIRKNKDSSTIQLTFFLEDKQIESINQNLDSMDIQVDDILIIRREIFKDGKSINKINNINVTLSTLKAISPFLVEIHGQNEYLDLKEEKHIEILDNYIKSQENFEEYFKYKEKFGEYVQLRKDIKKIKDLNKTHIDDSRYDFLISQKYEIEKANIKEGELEEISREMEILQSSQKISNYLKDFYTKISDSNENVSDIFLDGMNNFGQISHLGENLSQIEERIKGLYYEIDDLGHEIANIMDDYEYDEKEFFEVENRFNTINHIMKKYGDSYENLKEYYHGIISDINELAEAKSNLTKLEKQNTLIQKELVDLAEKVTEKRRRYKRDFEEKIIKELKSIGMNEVIFEIDISSSKSYNVRGVDKVVFKISFNIGEDLRPLSVVASGGELSRFSLALKSLGLYDSDKTMIFDEIDTGISGLASEKIGVKLKEISSKNQTLCITHQSQIASFAENHYLIYKYSDNNKTTIMTKKLDKDERIVEIARMIDGNLYSENSLKFSKELIEKNSGKIG